MTAKFSQAREDAFLQALRETGNQTIAAERAKVSRAWVQLRRSEDPAFRRAVEEAVEEARRALLVLRALRDGPSTSSLPPQGERDPSRRVSACGFNPPQGERKRGIGSVTPQGEGDGGGGSNEPPAGWGFLDGEELVVKGTGGSGGGKRVQIARARLKQWSPRVEKRFLAALASTCNVKAACAEVGMTAASAYNHRKRWQGFARRWDEAIETGYVRIEAGLLRAGENFFLGKEPPEDAPLHGMSVDHAIHLLHMHKNKVHGIGKAPGVSWKRPKTLDELAPSIMAKLQRFKRVLDAELSEEQIAEDEAEWARRRTG